MSTTFWKTNMTTPFFLYDRSVSQNIETNHKWDTELWNISNTSSPAEPKLFGNIYFLKQSTKYRTLKMKWGWVRWLPFSLTTWAQGPEPILRKQTCLLTFTQWVRVHTFTEKIKERRFFGCAVCFLTSLQHQRLMFLHVNTTTCFSWGFSPFSHQRRYG